MSARQFKLRTSELKLPSSIIDKYEEVCKQCETCQKHHPAPVRSRVSGLRATEFGDLVFIDHGSIKVNRLLFQFLIIVDAATMFIQVYAIKSTGIDESISCVRDFLDTFHCKPRSLVGDSAFQVGEWPTFYRKNGIKLIPVGRYTPWPNRAEAAVRLFKRHFSIMITSIQQDPELGSLTPREIMKMACFARNSNITYGGKTPVELVFGR